VGFLKDRVYRDAPESIIELKDRIREVIGEADAEMCENVIQNHAIILLCYYIIMLNYAIMLSRLSPLGLTK
jgi:hypothetical protein